MCSVRECNRKSSDIHCILAREFHAMFAYYHLGLFSHRQLNANVLPYCPAVTPPPFATYFQEKEGGGRNNEDLRFRLAVKPPPLSHEFAYSVVR